MPIESRYMFNSQEDNSKDDYFKICLQEPGLLIKDVHNTNLFSDLLEKGETICDNSLSEEN